MREKKISHNKGDNQHKVVFSDLSTFNDLAETANR